MDFSIKNSLKFVTTFRRGAYKALRGQHFKRTNLPYKLSGVKCRGNERSLAECQHNGWNNASNCMMDHEAGVICCQLLIQFFI